MRLIRLMVSGVRNLQPTDLRPAAGLNLVTGANGAGKTSLLEAIHLLAYGRSFRGRVRDGLIQSGAGQVEVFAEWEDLAGRVRKLGLQHEGKRWQGRLDGRDVKQLGALCGPFAALTFEPGSHALLDGGGEPRRRYLDWGLFHVEQDEGPEAFHSAWRRYGRALKQRNAALKQGANAAGLEVWEREMAVAGDLLTRQRMAYIERLQPCLGEQLQHLAPTLGPATFQFSPGWRNEHIALHDALTLSRDRDRVLGFTSVGPHRADWRITFLQRPRDEALSRGQGKLTALACLLAQADDFAAQRGHWPLVLLDDLAAELDRTHQAHLVARLIACEAQVFITGTEPPSALSDVDDLTVFHVEHGAIFPQ